MTPDKQSLHHRGDEIASTSTSTSRTSTPTTLASEEERDDTDPSFVGGEDLLAATTANQSTIIILAAGGRGRGGIDPPEVVNGAIVDTNINNISSLTSNAASSSFPPDNVPFVIPPTTHIPNEGENTPSTHTIINQHRRGKWAKSFMATKSLLTVTDSKYTTLNLVAIGAFSIAMLITIVTFRVVYVALDESREIKDKLTLHKAYSRDLWKTIDQDKAYIRQLENRILQLENTRIILRQEDETVVASSPIAHLFFEESFSPNDDDFTVANDVLDLDNDTPPPDVDFTVENDVLNLDDEAPPDVEDNVLDLNDETPPNDDFTVEDDVLNLDEETPPDDDSTVEDDVLDLDEETPPDDDSTVEDDVLDLDDEVPPDDVFTEEDDVTINTTSTDTEDEVEDGETTMFPSDNANPRADAFTDDDAYNETAKPRADTFADEDTFTDDDAYNETAKPRADTFTGDDAYNETAKPRADTFADEETFTDNDAYNETMYESFFRYYSSATWWTTTLVVGGITYVMQAKTRLTHNHIHYHYGDILLRPVLGV